jgi:glutamine synthetase
MLVEYVWIDGDDNVRSKTRIVDKIINWNYDGSSTGQASGCNSEVELRPVREYKAPAGWAAERLVLCETYYMEQPHPSNARPAAAAIIAPDYRFGFEQEFFLADRQGVVLAFSEGSTKPAEQGPYYCGVGNMHPGERECIEEAMKACLAAGIPLTGMNREVAPSQWELQVDAMGIAACDHMWMMRYILGRVAESYGMSIIYHPKPLLPDSDKPWGYAEWNGSGCHVNFSTVAMRETGGAGYENILRMIRVLESSHSVDIAKYGKDNHLRLTGQHETGRMDTFTWGVADRCASIRIPRDVAAAGGGYLEDRRPAANINPYVVAACLSQAARAAVESP